MSRTIRRKKSKKRGWSWIDTYKYEWVRVKDSYCSVKVLLDPQSQQYKVGKAKYHSDGATHSFKEPGPGWFRNLFTDRPERRYNKNELRKWMLDPDYEPMVSKKRPLEYWT